jgi:hypothetical protein
MAAQNEETPLLGEGRPRSVGSRSIDISSDTLTDSSGRGDEEELENDDKANQHVTRWRGSLIILSLWGLIFLQGETGVFSVVRYTMINMVGDG